MAAPLHSHPRNPPTLDRPPQRRSRPSLPRKSHSLPQRHGRPRPLRTTLPHLRPAHPAHPLRRQRNQLLRPMPDQRQSPRRPQPLPSPGQRLAPHPRRTGSSKKTLTSRAVALVFIAVAFAVACFLVVIPQRSGGICCCLRPCLSCSHPQSESAVAVIITLPHTITQPPAPLAP